MKQEDIKKEEVNKAINTITNFIKDKMFYMDSKTTQKWIEVVRSIEQYWHFVQENSRDMT